MATRSMKDYESVGFGGLSFLTNMNFCNTPMSYEQRLWALEGLYAFALAKIEEDPHYKDDEGLGLLIGGTRLLLDQAGEDYKSIFESHATFGELENKYRALLCIIFQRITQLQGKTKMIERVRADAVEA